MPGSAREVANAEEEGVEFVWLSSPKEFKGTNKVERLLVDQIKLGEPDESGRRQPIVQQGSDYEIKADMVIKALGFDPEDLPKNVTPTHVNLNDQTNEGIECKNLKVFSVQHHPESSPGPHDSRYLFDKFIKLMKS